ncbi:MAG: endo-1,4-beta-xylanase [Terriglobales bacterium]
MKWWAVALTLATWAFCQGPDAVAPEPSLREAAASSSMLIGTAVRTAQLSESAYASTLARQFNMLEPEDALKWEVVHPERQTFDFYQADQIVEFAGRHGMKIRGHTLVWHRQNPKWLTEGKFASTELAEILEKHIKTVVGHYRGKIFAWDVVNEASDEVHPGELRSTIWRDQPGIGPTTNGYGYMERCFRWAHEADPQALLFYNEGADTEAVNAKSDAIYAMVRDFRQRGVPIDGVGLQMHVSNLHADVKSVAANIRRFTALGVQIHITEMDVSLPVDANGNATAADLQAEADVYRKIAVVCLANPGCTAIQTWGFTDKYSWIGSHSKHTQGAALLFDRNYRAKPATEALRNALAAGRP